MPGTNTIANEPLLPPSTGAGKGYGSNSPVLDGLFSRELELQKLPDCRIVMGQSDRFNTLLSRITVAINDKLSESRNRTVAPYFQGPSHGEDDESGKKVAQELAKAFVNSKSPQCQFTWRELFCHGGKWVVER